MTPTPPPRAYEIIAYFPEWEYQRPYLVKNIETTGSAGKLTLINYAFGFPAPDEQTGAITCQMRDPFAAYQQAYTADMSIDGRPDDPNQPLRGHFNQLKKLKARHPGLRVVISLGGWTDSTWFSDAATPQARETFVASCIELYVRGNLPLAGGAGGEGAAAGVFDGIDIDWEYPIDGGLEGIHNRQDDAANFVLLLQEFRRQYQAIGRPDLLLTMAGPATSRAANYNMTEAHPFLDLVNIMTYDMRGAWSREAGHHTNLCPSAADPAPAAERASADAAMRLYRDTLGVPAEKLVLGAAFYGRSWKGVAAQDHGLYQPGQGIDWNDSNYYRLVERMRQGYKRYWDDSARAPWLYSESEQTFWSYDDPQSLSYKAQYVKYHQLGGIMFWEISGDDANGGMVEAIYQGLKGEAPEGDPCGGRS